MLVTECAHIDYFMWMDLRDRGELRVSRYHRHLMGAHMIAAFLAVMRQTACKRRAIWDGSCANFMDEQAIKEFWQGHPCGDTQVGGLRDRFQGDYDRFFTDYDQFRYQNERHLGLHRGVERGRQEGARDRIGRRR